MPRPIAIVFMLAMTLVLGLSSRASAEANPLIDVLKQKGIVSEEEAGRLEQQLDDYYQKKMAPAPAPAAPAPVAKEAAPAVSAEERLKKLEEAGKRHRVNWGGEARFRVMDEFGETPQDWAGERVSLTSATTATDSLPVIGGKEVFAISSIKQINPDLKDSRAVSFPLRMRLNWDAQVVPDWIDVWGRFTINKRWGTFSSTPENDPFNAPNSFAASIGSEIALRVEEIYTTIKVPYVPWDVTWYVGRLPGMDGAPSRQARSIFPRLFIDSEIDGSLLKVALPELPTSDTILPWSQCPVEGLNGSKFRGGPMGQYDAKAKDESAIYFGYLDYQESKLTSPNGKDSTLSAIVPIAGHGPSSDVWLGQVQVKLLKDTELILNGLWMPDWYMPRQDFNSNNSFTQTLSPVFNPIGGDSGRGSWTPGLDVPFFTSDYLLYGGYFDTQFLGFQLYGSLYFDHLDVPPFAYELLLPNADGTTTRSTPVEYEGNDFEGYIWHVGMNSGSWLAKWNMSFCAEYAKGSNAWINPFNYRGYRRKGTVLYPEKNSFFGGNSVVGFYPFNAGVLDTYLDYYWSKARFRLGVIYFNYDRREEPGLTRVDDTTYTVEGGPDSILGWSRYKTNWWPYFEINCSF